MKTINLPIILILFLVLGSCKKEDPKPGLNPDDLVGIWDVESHRLEGSEQLNIVYLSLQYEFEPLNDGVGNFFLRYTDYQDYSGEWKGVYRVFQDSHQIEILPDREGPILLDVTLDGDKITLSGLFINGNTVTIAKKQ
ncbi:MAG: hypothetical protein R2879_08260 [Saprospiraceae bacterium]